MEFLVETLKNASLHIHAVWLAIAYIAVILAMANGAARKILPSSLPKIVACCMAHPRA